MYARGVAAVGVYRRLSRRHFAQRVPRYLPGTSAVTTLYMQSTVAIACTRSSLSIATNIATSSACSSGALQCSAGKTTVTTSAFAECLIASADLKSPMSVSRRLSARGREQGGNSLRPDPAQLPAHNQQEKDRNTSSSSSPQLVPGCQSPVIGGWVVLVVGTTDYLNRYIPPTLVSVARLARTLPRPSLSSVDGFEGYQCGPHPSSTSRFKTSIHHCYLINNVMHWTNYAL